ncbi:MAG: winged helix-turn-helix domain-containing protein [Roseateles asaccharophilus]|uniref:Tetratricopeptide repeat protein n=1 Tax=Roseateles asaccharophilus TaxID=582607 RepID=A0A4V3CKB9_9BURK|nr:winged helix-turn-helix domain-containing protein [Roseateles asaccharophilus]MDN3542963.1 winged helix-turn-helix domain-containing protein [Roseateles asaccharophilus]TDP13337.1 tetratricopeptide repeat protein [Roseateles asaccharophilus]
MSRPESLGPGGGVDSSAERTLQIGEWQADPVLDELRRGEQVLKLEPRKMRLLMALARRPQQLVTLDQLLDEVWGDLVVTPSSVYQSISQLRSVLGDEASQPRYIVTVPRKGYRLVAAVSEVGGPATPAPAAGATLQPLQSEPELEPRRRATDQREAPPVPPTLPASAAPSLPSVPSRRLLLGGSAAAAALLGAGGWWAWQRATRTPAADITLAVLPFDDASPKELEQPLAEGLAESVIGALSRHQQIRVAARATSFQFRSAQDLAPQATQLAVTHVLWGELRRWQQGLSLKLSLHRAADSEVLWQQVLESPAAALGSLAESVANAALRALGVAPLPAHAKPVPLADAYEFYLLGLHHQRGGQIEGILKARDYFQRAVDADPGFALAYVGLAVTWTGEYFYGTGLSFRAMDARTQPLIDRALKLDPELPLALGAQGSQLSHRGQHDEARLWHERALAKAPHDATLLYWAGSTENSAGWPARALSYYSRAAELSPLAPQIQHLRGVAATNAGRYELAEQAYRRAITLAPQHPNGQWGLGIIGFARGQLDEAVQGYRKALLINPNRAYLWEQLAWVYLDLGMVDEAGRAFAQFQAQSAQPAWARVTALRTWVCAQDQAALRKAVDALPAQSKERDAVIELALLRLLLGQPEQAHKILASVVGLVLADPVPLYNEWGTFLGQHAWLDVAAVYHATGRREEAEPFIEQASSFVERYAKQGNVWHAIGYHRARMAAMRGQPEAALAALEDAVRLGWRRGWWLAQDPALQSLRELPRFKAVLARIEDSNRQQRQRLLA